jgi:glutamate--cysteine ligase
MDFFAKGFEDLELSTQIIINEAQRRALEVEVLDRDNNFISIKSTSKIEYIQQATMTSVDTYISPLIMANKLVTKNILAKKNIRIPEGKIYADTRQALDEYDLYELKDIVVKPNTTNFGVGITLLKKEQGKNDFEAALHHAFEYDKSVIVEEFIHGKEYRFLIIGDEVAGILHRVPANVIGDGIHSIKQLVDKKNQNPLRGKGYKTPLERIQCGKAEENYLKLQNKTFETIPDNGAVVYLRKNSNVSTGGDSIDYTDEVIDAYKEIAVKAAQVVGAKICGADIIIEDIKQDPTADNFGIIELNFNPALHIHNFPYKGKNRDVGRKILDLLGF